MKSGHPYARVKRSSMDKDRHHYYDRKSGCIIIETTNLLQWIAMKYVPM
jgi:hypothetical protein